ncbi:MAG TPA: hypothetical protein ENG51_01070 [Deltaproteobacteria bacterium]|nr:hypothetical protein [Deltaproteobacteria bacterium]
MKQIIKGENSFERDDCIATRLVKDWCKRADLLRIASKYSVNSRSMRLGVAICALPRKRFAFCRVSIADQIALPLLFAMSKL